MDKVELLKKSGIKVREFPESNYKAVYMDGKTIRFQIDPNRPITVLKYPEFWDIAITNVCNFQCKYCYMGALSTRWSSVTNGSCNVKKLYSFFSGMDSNQKPFQVALGGAEPTLHPSFIDILVMFNELGIIPNYTTNGQNSIYFSEIAKKLCGGVAVSVHDNNMWMEAYDNYVNAGVKTNLHIIISDKQSIDRFREYYNNVNDSIYYFVLLPYVVKGRAVYKQIEYDYFFEVYNSLPDKSKIAFGAKFYPELLKRKVNLSLYEPELMSKFLDALTMKVKPSSFSA